MATPFRLQIYTQERKVYDGAVTSIVVPAASGYLGVWAHHAPLVALLGKGTLTIKSPPAEEIQVRIEGGFLEVRDNVATLLADSLEGGEKLQPAA
jgi:F-type H+-transporting ATPase subunit epsilon